MELSLIFSKKKAFPMFRKIGLSSPKNKTFEEGTFQARKIKQPQPKKISYLSGNGTF